MNFFYNVYTEASSVESLEVYLQDHSDELYDIYALTIALNRYHA